MITIGMSVYDSIKVDTAVCLVGAVGELGRLGYKVRLEVQKGFYVHNYREDIVQRTLQSEATHLMFIDADMTFLPAAIPTLIQRGLPIVGAPYVMKTPPHSNIIKRLEGDKIVGWGHKMPTEPFRCLSVGTGFMLIDVTAFSKIEPPYFRIELEGVHMIGEDVSFCRRMNQAGVEVWCDPTIPIGHIGEQTYMVP